MGLLAIEGCITTDQQAVPLYDQPTRLGRDQVATLGGYVASVDGRDVSKLGGAFELLPGCHVITTPTGWGASSGMGAIKATTGAVSFVVPMFPGRHYLVVSNPGPLGTVTVQINEMDAAGHDLRAIWPTRAAEEVLACHMATMAY